jgi:glycosyltransferase involved in cell wall biosynthesis
MRWLFLLILSLAFSVSAFCESQKTIAIFTYKVLGASPWDPESVRSGVTGSEEAVIYVAQKLAKIGHKVLVLGDPPQNSSHSCVEANPRFVDTAFDDGTFFDIAISWRMPEKAGELKNRARKVYLWPHDTYSESLTDEQITGFDDVFWLSNWQREYWISINPGFAKFTKIFGNGINPEQFHPMQERSNPYSCIYASNYARGLDILLDIWPVVRHKFPKATLDIYYGWQHWGLLSEKKEALMRSQIAALAQFGVREHGLVSHEELNRAHEQTSFWTYPCTGWEVFCIGAIRAQSSGAMPVIIDGTALPETVRFGYRCAKREEYLSTLLKALEHAETISLQERCQMRDFVFQEYTWEAIAKKWSETFDN